MKNILTIMLLLFLSIDIDAQNRQEWEKYYDQLGDLEDAETESWESTYDELCELSAHPINLNTATREQLESLPFLSAQQIEDISEYIYKYGGLKSWGELSLITSLDNNRQKLITYFTTIDEQSKDYFPSMADISKYGKQELVATAKIPLYEREGDRNGYLGYQYKHWLKYTFQYGQHVKFGAVASQDAGEPFFAGRNKLGYDYYSLYLMIRNMGRLKALAVGRYRLRFGMGLVLNNDFGLGKIATLATLGRSANAIHAHSSRSEGNFLQGAAATVKLTKGLDLTAFASYRKIDATLNNDTNTIATILKTGYHRTESEMNRRNNASEFLGGGNVHFTLNGFHAGATALFTSFDRALDPKTSQRYRRYYPNGKAFWNASIDYGYVSRRLNINGETATGDSHALATINSISYMLTDKFSLMALQRFYSYKYYALYGESFSEGGAVSDESGIYVGANWHPWHNLSIMAYTDYAYFAWPKYQADNSSHAWDNLVTVTYQHKEWTLLARYRVKMREKDNTEKNALIYKTEQRGRVSVGYNGNRWTWKTQADVAHCRYTDTSFGYMLSQNVGYTHHWLSANASIGYFNTDDYNSRVYTYERGTLYNFSFPSFYGEGIRYAINVRADISKTIMLIAKVGTTDYFDRSTIGTSLQEIAHSSQTDVDLQVRWRF